MPLSHDAANTIARLNRVATNLKLLFARRDAAVDLLRLALVTREHCLLLGPPGTGKSELVARFADGVNARRFDYLLTRFTEPSELFGPIDIERFQGGTYVVNTAGMLPEAEIAFLDEVFQASSAILNTLLSVVHERIFHNGAQRTQVPLIALFGASNQLPDDPTLRAFSDRFVLRLEMTPVADEHLGDLLERGWALEQRRLTAAADDTAALLAPEQLGALHRELAAVKLGPLQTQYQELARQLRAEGVELSDRRLVKGLKLIRGAALLEGRDQATPADLWPLLHCWNAPEDRAVLAEVIQPLVDEAGGPAGETHRSIPDLTDALDLLESRAADLTGQGAQTAHLGALAQIRRELLLHHPDEAELRGRTEAVIARVLEGMREELG
ncbi:AAA family ATPase [Thiohalocapsa sp. ML1]|uniref:AAA family ATPase n=1 Tax=Thiohalocapsa sp. ML1 TaxID=1431688 RepID=UPI000732394A|nr:AAA family ATPase [Thiohalocapsa sp. ML1]